MVTPAQIIKQARENPPTGKAWGVSWRPLIEPVAALGIWRDYFLYLDPSDRPAAIHANDHLSQRIADLYGKDAEILPDRFPVTSRSGSIIGFNPELVAEHLKTAADLAGYLRPEAVGFQVIWRRIGETEKPALVYVP